MATKKQSMQTNQFMAVDGVSIFYRVLRTSAALASNQKPRVLVVQHGFGEHSGRYVNLWNALDDLPLIIYLLDARGHGNSGAARGVVRPFEKFTVDLDQMIEIALKNENETQAMLLGHSMGAVISALYAQQKNYQKKLSALILSSLALRVKMNLVMKIKKTLAPLIEQVAPDLVLSAGLDARHISRDAAVVKAYQSDPLVHGKISATLGNFLAHAEEHLLPHVSEITIPLYMFHGKNDLLADCSGSEVFFQQVSSQQKKLNLYDGLFHETINELEVDRNRVLSDLSQWIKQRL